MRETVYRKVTGVIIRFWYLPLVFCAVLTVFCYPYTERLFKNISTDLIKLLPHDYTSVRELEKIRAKFEGWSNLAIVLESDNPENTKKALIFLAGELEKDPKVATVTYKKVGYEFFDKHKLLFLDLEDLESVRDRIDRKIQKEKLGGLYVDFGEDEDEKFTFGDIESKYKKRYSPGARSEFITDDGGRLYTIVTIIADKSETLPSFNAFYDYIKNKVAGLGLKSFDPSLEVYFAGAIKNRIDEYNALLHDLKVAGLVSGIGIFLLLAIYFKRPFSVVIIFAPLVAGIIYSFAFANIFVQNLNVVTSFLFAVLGGLGVEVGIHMFARYIEERSSGKEVAESIFTILHFTGRSAITSGLAVAAAFLILTVNDFKGFSEFGFITGAGIVIVYLTYHLVFPSILILSEKIKLLKFKPVALREAGAAEAKFPFSKKILIATAVVFLLSLAAMPFTGFEYNFANLKANIKETKVAREKLLKTSASVNRPAIVLIKNLDEALAVKNYIAKNIEEDEKTGHPPVINAYKSWYDIIQYNQKEKMEVIGEIKALLADKTIKLVKGEHKKDLDRFEEVLNETEPISPGEVPQGVKDMFFGTKDDGYQASYINAEPHLEFDDGRNAIEFAERIENIETPKGTFHASSDSVVFAGVLRTMLADVPRVVLLSFMMVFFFVWLDFRSFKKASLVMSPIVLGVVIMFGLMFILRMKLNFYNMIVVPTVFGTSIDNSIHIYHRFEEMGKKSLMQVLKTSGGAALMSSMTNIFGFLGLVFAAHQGLASIGKLAIVGMGSCLFTTLVYFPAVLQWLSKSE